LCFVPFLGIPQDAVLRYPPALFFLRYVFNPVRDHAFFPLGNLFFYPPKFRLLGHWLIGAVPNSSPLVCRGCVQSPRPVGFCPPPPKSKKSPPRCRADDFPTSDFRPFFIETQIKLYHLLMDGQMGRWRPIVSQVYPGASPLAPCAPPYLQVGIF